MEFRVYCDQRHLKGFTRPEFKKFVIGELRPFMPSHSLIQIEMLDSEQHPNIQIADWIAGSLARFLEKKPLGQEYYEILKNNIIGDGKEIFPLSR